MDTLQPPVPMTLPETSLSLELNGLSCDFVREVQQLSKFFIPILLTAIAKVLHHGKKKQIPFRPNNQHGQEEGQSRKRR
nr:hypothetical protein CFP56_76768 [Quercus suber]